MSDLTVRMTSLPSPARELTIFFLLVLPLAPSAAPGILEEEMLDVILKYFYKQKYKQVSASAVRANETCLRQDKSVNYFASTKYAHTTMQFL